MKVIFLKDWLPYVKGNVESFSASFLEGNQMFHRGLVEVYTEPKEEPEKPVKTMKAAPKDKQVKKAADK